MPLLLLLPVAVVVAVAVDVHIAAISAPLVAVDVHIAVAVDVQICKTRQLKAKAKSTKMDELVQILVIKASLWSQEDEEKKSGASSVSKDAWTPSSPKSAFEKIEELMRAADKDSVGRFAEALKAKSKSVQEDDA